MPKKRNIFALLLVFLLIYLGWKILHSPNASAPASNPPQHPTVQVKVAQAIRGYVAARIHAVGTLLADESVVLRPEIDGRVQAIHFSEGMQVKAGQLLVELNSDEQRTAVTRSEAQENLENQSFERIRAVRARNLVSQQQYDETLARLKNATAQLAQDRVRLAKTRLTAPFDGMLGLRHVSPGDYVSSGQDLVNLEAIDPVKVDFQIPEKYAGMAKIGLSVSVSVDAYPGKGFTGTVYAIDPRLDEATRSIRLRAQLPNPKLLLRPGMFARIDADLDAGHESVLVPEQCLVSKGSQALLFRLDGDHATAVSVKTGERQDGMVEIIEGLNGGEWIVTDGQGKLRDGTRVTTGSKPQQ